MNNLDHLREVIHKLHGAKATHVESVPVKEVWQGQTVWEGNVEVFYLHGHPKTHRAYAWSHTTTDDTEQHVTVLHIPPVVDALTAVRAAILKDYQDAQTA